MEWCAGGKIQHISMSGNVPSVPGFPSKSGTVFRHALGFIACNHQAGNCQREHQKTGNP